MGINRLNYILTYTNWNRMNESEFPENSLTIGSAKNYIENVLMNPSEYLSIEVNDIERKDNSLILKIKDLYAVINITMTMEFDKDEVDNPFDVWDDLMDEDRSDLKSIKVVWDNLNVPDWNRHGLNYLYKGTEYDIPKTLYDHIRSDYQKRLDRLDANSNEYARERLLLDREIDKIKEKIGKAQEKYKRTRFNIRLKAEYLPKTIEDFNKLVKVIKFIPGVIVDIDTGEFSMQYPKWKIIDTYTR